MLPDYLLNALVFLIETVFGIYIFLLLLRFIFQWIEADYSNPLSQALIKVTHPPLKVLRRIIPSIARIDTASIVLMFGLQLITDSLVFWLKGMSLTFSALGVWSLAQLLDLILIVYFYSIILRALVSWVGNGAVNPATELLYSFTEPLLRSCRRVIPMIVGLDWSPIIPLIGIQLARILLVQPLRQLAEALN